MSFTSTVKNEITTITLDGMSNISLLSALVKTIGTIYPDKLILMTENISVANLLFRLFKDLYDISAKITVRNGYNFNKNYIYILEITNRLDFILNDLSIKKDHKVLDYPEEYIISDNELIRAYFMGLFLGTGSVNNPEKSSYHMEFSVDTEEYATFISNLLNQYQLNSKIIRRENKYMIYMNDA